MVRDSSLSGQAISRYVDPDPFERVASGQVELYDAQCRDTSRDLNARLIAYALPNEDRLVGIFVSEGEPGEDARRLSRLRDETVLQAGPCTNSRSRWAREFANYLGQQRPRRATGQKMIEAVESEDAPGGVGGGAP
jgi:hypothetical protein